MKKDETKSVHEGTLAMLRRCMSKESSMVSLSLDEENFKRNVEMVVNPLIQDYKNLTGFNVEIVYSNHVYYGLENLIGIVVGESTSESEFTVKINKLSISYPSYIHVIKSFGVDAGTKALNNTLKSIERSFKEATFHFKTNKAGLSTVYSDDTEYQRDQFITKLINNMESIVAELHAIRNSLSDPHEAILLDTLKEYIRNIHTYVRFNKFKMVNGVYQPATIGLPTDSAKHKYELMKKNIEEALQEIQNTLSDKVQHTICDVLHSK